MGIAGSLNVYQYVESNPIKLIDTLGFKGMSGYEKTNTGNRNPEPQILRPKSGIEIDKIFIKDVLKGDPMKTVQERVSLPAIQLYYDRLLAGEIPPPIKVDNGIIIVENHRYVAAKLYGIVPEITPSQIAPSKSVNVKPFEHLTIDPFDWGNH